MRFSSGLSLMLVVLSGALACASESEPVSIPSEPTVDPPDRTELKFEQSGTLVLAPGERRTLTVLADPPGAYALSFAMIGDVRDARLDRGSAVTDTEGRASVEIRAADTVTTFHVRAWIEDGPFTEVAVAVSGDSFGDLRILPQYNSSREVGTWTASIVPRTNCAAIAPMLPEDPAGAILATAPAKEPIVVKNLPVGPNLAVAVRAGHYAWGCVDMADLVANGEVAVKVDLADKPLDLSATDLELTLGFTPPEEPYQGILASSRDALVGAFLPEDNPAAALALLDAMAAAYVAGSEVDAQAFAAARSAGGWDALATDHLTALPTPLGDQLDAWMLTSSAEPLVLHGRLRAQGSPSGLALFEPIRLGIVDAAAAGMPAEHLVTWTGQPGDKVHLGASLFWLPSRYMAGLCRAAALTGAGVDATMADALAVAADCEGLATTLGGLDKCDAACVAGLCKKALASRWEAAIDASASAGQIGEIDVVAAGTAKVDDWAAPLSFAGAWSGSLSDGQIAAPIDKAPVMGEPPPPAEPPP
ncbi:hypothetical protein [Polyangium aurulentum]|uniref:hypothetical protein n=1 Tax=Polyangium aurulentum TaxID=2567896 RepID=UPI0010AE5E05|nr:hypothetical protein [Polyangium aurulentum]UQA57966.1 hypothetical protein E8A73_042975 [Polyangium aurulentum]